MLFGFSSFSLWYVVGVIPGSLKQKKTNKMPKVENEIPIFGGGGGGGGFFGQF